MEILVSETFHDWLTNLKDTQAKTRITKTIRKSQTHGKIIRDTKQLSPDLWELRLHYGPGYRIYYTINKTTITILLVGGHKKTQQKDINKAHRLITELE